MTETTNRGSAASAKRRLFGKTPAEGNENTTTAPSSTLTAESNVIPSETPQKKQKVGQNFNSPTDSRPVVTPDKGEDDEDEVEVVSSPPLKKTRLHERYSPQSKKKKPEREKAYVPTYIHKNLSYKRRGTASLPDKVKTIFNLVVDHHDIPEDFERNRCYGPLSGISYEERVIGAYNLSMLEPKEGTAVEICSSCANMGHKRNDCPDLI